MVSDLDISTGITEILNNSKHIQIHNTKKLIFQDVVGRLEQEA